MNKRIVLYWHNGLGLGHTSISAKIAHALLKSTQYSKAIIGVTGASLGLELLPKEMDVLKLPSYLAYDLSDGFHIEPVLGMTEAELFNIRSKLVCTFIEGFQPDVLVVDFHPQGTHGELVPALLSSPNTIKVLGLRGIIWGQKETQEEFFSKSMSTFIDKHYSKILIYTDPSLFRLEEYYRLPDKLLDKVEYTGYLAEPIDYSRADAKAILGLHLGKRVIVANFGGGQGTYELWQKLITALSHLNGLFDIAYLVAGPYLEAASYEKLRGLTLKRPNLIWQRFVTDMPLLMRASDVYIGAGGLNSLGEIIATEANALVIPRQKNESEQQIHTELLSRFRLLRMFELEQMSDVYLAERIKRCLEDPRPARISGRMTIDIQLSGASRAAELISSLL